MLTLGFGVIKSQVRVLSVRGGYCVEGKGSLDEISNLTREKKEYPAIGNGRL